MRQRVVDEFRHRRSLLLQRLRQFDGSDLDAEFVEHKSMVPFIKFCDRAQKLPRISLKAFRIRVKKGGRPCTVSEVHDSH